MVGEPRRRRWLSRGTPQASSRTEPPDVTTQVPENASSVSRDAGDRPKNQNADQAKSPHGSYLSPVFDYIAGLVYLWICHLINAQLQ
jgi:hypothetical protein